MVIKPTDKAKLGCYDDVLILLDAFCQEHGGPPVVADAHTDAIDDIIRKGHEVQMVWALASLLHVLAWGGSIEEFDRKRVVSMAMWVVDGEPGSAPGRTKTSQAIAREVLGLLQKKSQHGPN